MEGVIESGKNWLLGGCEETEGNSRLLPQVPGRIVVTLTTRTKEQKQE